MSIAPYFETENTRALVIAEVAQSHEGSLGLAHAFIDAAADSGADVVKFQTHIAAAESTAREPFRKKFSTQDATRYDYWKRMEFAPSEWAELAEHAKARGLFFLSSPFSLEAFELLEKIGMPAWKVASGGITHMPLLAAMAATQKPMIFSSGLATWAELDAAVSLAKSAGAPCAMLQTTTAYPTPPEQVGLNVLAEFQARYGCVVGVSDHSATIFPALAAYALGGRMVEVHLTLSPQMFGPDVVASLTPDALAQMVQGLRFLETAFANPVNKDKAAAENAELKRIFGRSIVAARALPAGHVLSAADIALKKPGGGLAPNQLAQVLGETLTNALAADDLIRVEGLA